MLPVPELGDVLKLDRAVGALHVALTCNAPAMAAARSLLQHSAVNPMAAVSLAVGRALRALQCDDPRRSLLQDAVEGVATSALQSDAPSHPEASMTLSASSLGQQALPEPGSGYETRQY